MRITQWGEYGVHCALYIAERERDGASPIGAQEIADSQHIALHYTQQILQRLRKGNVIESVRGPQGGYRLTRSPETITLRDVLVACEGETFEVICDTRPLDEERCAETSSCGLRPLWRELHEHINSFLTSHTLAELMRRTQMASAPVQLGHRH